MYNYKVHLVIANILQTRRNIVYLIRNTNTPYLLPHAVSYESSTNLQHQEQEPANPPANVYELANPDTLANPPPPPPPSSCESANPTASANPTDAVSTLPPITPVNILEVYKPTDADLIEPNLVEHVISAHRQFISYTAVDTDTAGILLLLLYVFTTDLKSILFTLYITIYILYIKFIYLNIYIHTCNNTLTYVYRYITA